jgi:hypothetical protein
MGFDLLRISIVQHSILSTDFVIALTTQWLGLTANLPRDKSFAIQWNLLAIGR